jgi:hypothetical protein
MYNPRAGENQPFFFGMRWVQVWYSLFAVDSTTISFIL